MDLPEFKSGLQQLKVNIKPACDQSNHGRLRLHLLWPIILKELVRRRSELAEMNQTLRDIQAQAEGTTISWTWADDKRIAAAKSRYRATPARHATAPATIATMTPIRTRDAAPGASKPAPQVGLGGPPPRAGAKGRRGKQQQGPPSSQPPAGQSGGYGLDGSRLRVNDRVQAWVDVGNGSEDKDGWLPGTIEALYADDTVDIMFDKGTSGKGWKMENVRKISTAAGPDRKVPSSSPPVRAPELAFPEEKGEGGVGELSQSGSPAARFSDGEPGFDRSVMAAYRSSDEQRHGFRTPSQTSEQSRSPPHSKPSFGRIVSETGVVVRESPDLRSKIRAKIDTNQRLEVAQDHTGVPIIKGNRVKIVKPVEGWASRYSSRSGRPLIKLDEGNGGGSGI